jgi:hypothetical protein
MDGGRLDVFYTSALDIRQQSVSSHNRLSSGEKRSHFTGCGAGQAPELTQTRQWPKSPCPCMESNPGCRAHSHSLKCWCSSNLPMRSILVVVHIFGPMSGEFI